MGTRQYIGARYVPKVFDYNGSSNWISGIAYEPLTIVTYLNNSYTSKKPVPSSVGSPNANPEYWANTGDYSGTVTTLEQEISDLRGDVQGVESAFDDLEDFVTNKKVVIIGDSYAMRNTPNYLSVLKAKMPTVYDGVGMSGYGFTNGTFEDEFDDFISNYTQAQKDAVTDIIFAGGWNDARELEAGRQTYTSLNETIHATCEHAKSVCTNAKVHVCFMAWHSALSSQNQVTNNSLILAMTAYDNVTAKNVSSLCDVKYIMRDYGSMDESLFHPNTAAGSLIAYALHNNLFSGSYNYKSKRLIGTADLESTGVIDTANGGSISLTVNKEKAVAMIKSNSVKLSGSPTGGVVFQFNPTDAPIVLPNVSSSYQLNGRLYGTVNGVSTNGLSVRVFVYLNGNVLVTVGTGLLSSVDGYLDIEGVIDTGEPA